MAGTLSHAEADEDIGAEPDRGGTPGTSRWKNVVGLFGLVVVLWVGSKMYNIVIFDGFGPGAGGDTPAPAVDQGPDGGGVHTPGPPAGGH